MLVLSENSVRNRDSYRAGVMREGVVLPNRGGCRWKGSPKVSGGSDRRCIGRRRCKMSLKKRVPNSTNNRK